MKKLTVSETIAQTCRLRPPLKPLLEVFEPLLSHRALTAEKLAPLLAEAGIALTGSPAEKPLLSENMPAGLAPFVRMAAEELLPVLAQQVNLVPHMTSLDDLFCNEDKAEAQEELVSAMLSDAPTALLDLASENYLDVQALEFTSEFIISAVLRALVLNSGQQDFSGWHKSKCPVCGSAPIIAWLSRRPLAANNEFLADGGGKKYLHCGMCGTDWHFLRGVCPYCGVQGQDAMQILGEEDRRHERIDWCKKCHAYLPQIDLREVADTPDMDAMALCLIHLDIFAAEKDLIPLRPSFWNMF